MTNEVQKIREEVERLKESGCASPIVICDTLLSFIDSMQEEPVSEDLKEAAVKIAKKITANTNSETVWSKTVQGVIAGANYVLKEIEIITKADLGSYKSQLDRIKKVIEQLKK